MARLLDWLSRNRGATVVIAAVYYAAVVLGHDVVQFTAYWLRDELGRVLWNSVVGGSALIGCAWIALGTVPRLGRPPSPGFKHACFWGTIALHLAAYFTLLGVAVEFVHFPQYALLAVLIFPLAPRIGWTVLIVTLLGAADELYQYLVLRDDWRTHYDVNDVVLNAIGAGLGAAMITTFGGVRRAGAIVWKRVWGPFLAASLLFGGGSLLLHGTGHLALYQAEAKPHTVILVSRGIRPEKRWETPDWGASHYVLHAGSALAICLALVGLYTGLDHRFSWTPRTEEPE